MARIQRFLDIPLDVLKAIEKDDELPYFEEFYRAHKRRKYLNFILLRISLIAKKEMIQQKKIKDFNDLLLQQKARKNINEANLKAARYVANELLLLKRHDSFYRNIHEWHMISQRSERLERELGESRKKMVTECQTTDALISRMKQTVRLM